MWIYSTKVVESLAGKFNISPLVAQDRDPGGIMYCAQGNHDVASLSPEANIKAMDEQNHPPESCGM